MEEGRIRTQDPLNWTYDLRRSYEQRVDTNNHMEIYTPINKRSFIDIKSLRHQVFPGGPPSKYYPGPTMLNFRDQTRTGVFIVVWS